MANNDYDVGVGPHSLQGVPTTTVLSPADTNATNKVIKDAAPMRWARDGASGYGTRAVLCLVDTIPELIAIHRMETPNFPVGVIQLPNAAANMQPANSFMLLLPFTGAIPAGGELGVLADGLGGYKVVAVGGIGRYIKTVGTKILVEF